MFGALALMPLDRLNECMSIIKTKASLLTGLIIGKSVNDFVTYFEKTSINGKWPPKVWNYFDFIVRKTNNDLENFNKHYNIEIHSKSPTIFKFISFIKTRDAAIQAAALDYRANPCNPSVFQINSKKLNEIQKDLDHKNAFINNKITLADYPYAQAANIDYIEYVDADVELQDETIVNDEIQVLTQVLPDLTDILNHDQYQLDLAKNMGALLNEDSVSLFESVTFVNLINIYLNLIDCCFFIFN